MPDPSMRKRLKQAQDDLDAVLGAGFARSSPQLVSAYLHADALHEIDSTFAQAIGIINKAAAGTVTALLRKFL